ncbi:HMCN1-like protein [Mya arenaria]|uniref:HMCN1-like protein n=1 Tax=Mya arenaria TaxID=6604 RepID=A0ABY7E545_MYAAR|nr:HMCN1-like protein [Mya arenaria]
MELFLLFGIILCNQVRSGTLTGNGTSGGFTVQENASLELTCSTSIVDGAKVFAEKLLGFGISARAILDNGPRGCEIHHLWPLLSCSCVSSREYICVIRTVTRAMNGDVWFCVTQGGRGGGNNSLGITSVSMVSPAGNSVSIIEDTAQQFRCETSVGNPQATVEWYKDNGTLDRSDDTEIITGKETNTSASGTLIVTVGKLSLTVQRNDHKVGVYCRANNVGPKVQLPQTYDVLEGSVVNYSCSFIPGNPPSQTSFVWTRSIDRRQWNSQFFSIASVQKLDDDMYTCTATPAGSPAQTGNSGTMHLNVQCIVTQFHVIGNRNEANITQTEKSSTTFTCMVDSIPPSTIKIKKDGELRRSVNHSTQLEYPIANLACTDAGLYTCDASNQFNFDKHSAKDLHMRPPGKDIKLNFTARLHNSVTLQYTVVAYPVPSASQFVWKRCFRRKMCIQLSNITAKYEITTSGLSSSLTIVDTDIDDFGAYSLSVKNGIGKELVEDLFLQPFEVADAKPHIAAIAGGVTAGVITMVAIVVVFCLLRKGSRSRPTVGCRIPKHDGEEPSADSALSGTSEFNV